MSDIAAFNIWLCILFIMLAAKFDPEYKLAVWLFRMMAVLGVINASIETFINAS